MTESQNPPPNNKKPNKSAGNLDDTPTTRMFSIAAIVVFGGLLPLILWSLVSDTSTQDVPDILLGNEKQLVQDKAVDDRAVALVTTGDAHMGKQELDKAKTCYDEAIKLLETPVANDNKLARQSRATNLIRAHRRRAEFFKKSNKQSEAQSELAEAEKIAAAMPK